uniref:Uncharacterized protein n=1 Tax=Ixodes ricinus TaxID=34613 RepID=A0A6B0UYV9_IXORI
MILRLHNFFVGGRDVLTQLTLLFEAPAAIAADVYNHVLLKVFFRRELCIAQAARLQGQKSVGHTTKSCTALPFILTRRILALLKTPGGHICFILALMVVVRLFIREELEAYQACVLVCSRVEGVPIPIEAYQDSVVRVAITILISRVKFLFRQFVGSLLSRHATDRLW